MLLAGEDMDGLEPAVRVKTYVATYHVSLPPGKRSSLPQKITQIAVMLFRLVTRARLIAPAVTFTRSRRRGGVPFTSLVREACGSLAFGVVDSRVAVCGKTSLSPICYPARWQISLGTVPGYGSFHGNSTTYAHSD